MGTGSRDSRGARQALEEFPETAIWLCNSVETRHNEKIGIIKDIAAAGVGIAMLAWLLVLGFEAGEMQRKLP